MRSPALSAERPCTGRLLFTMAAAMAWHNAARAVHVNRPHADADISQGSPFATFARTNSESLRTARTRRLQTGEDFPGTPQLQNFPLRGTYRDVGVSLDGQNRYDEYSFQQDCDATEAAEGGHYCGFIIVMDAFPGLFCRGLLYYRGTTPQPMHHLVAERTAHPAWGNAGTAARNISHHFRIHFEGYKLGDDGEIVQCRIPPDHYALDVSYLGDGRVRGFVHVQGCDPCDEPSFSEMPLDEPEKEEVAAFATIWFEREHGQALDPSVQVEVFDNCRLPHAEHGQHMFSVSFIGSDLEPTLRAFVFETAQDENGQVDWYISRVEPPDSGVELEPKHMKQFPDGTSEVVCNLNVTTPTSEVEALMVFKDDVNAGDTSIIRQWSIDGDPCAAEWPCVACTIGEDGHSAHVTQLLAANADLRGTIRWSPLRALGQLEEISLFKNHLLGVLPTEEDFASWPKLKVFNAFRNMFSGTLPSLDSTSPLRVFGPASNPISGTIPSSLCALQDLTQLDLAEFGPGLTGTIPSCIGEGNTQMIYVNLWGNPSLSGSLPPSMATWNHQLTHFQVEACRLSGTIPGSLLGNWSETLEMLTVEDNQISGTVPAETGLLQRARVVDFSNNRLTSLPNASVLANWSFQESLHQFYLSGNGFRSTTHELQLLAAALPTNLADFGISFQAVEAQIECTYMKPEFPGRCILGDAYITNFRMVAEVGGGTRSPTEVGIRNAGLNFTAIINGTSIGFVYSTAGIQPTYSLTVPGSSSQFVADGLFTKPGRYSVAILLNGELIDLSSINWLHNSRFAEATTYIEYLPIECRDPNSHRDSTSDARCVCNDGYHVVFDKVEGNVAQVCRPVICKNGQVSKGGRCIDCPLNEEAHESDDGTSHCVCKAGTMNITLGTITCYNKDECKDEVPDRIAGLVCVKCPECLDCETFSKPRIKADFGLTSQGAQDYHSMWLAIDQHEARDIHVFTCPISGACLGEIGNATSDAVISCKHGHNPDSPFCTLCQPDFMGGNNELCEPCTIESSASSELSTLLVVIIGVLLVIYGGMALYKKLAGCLREKNAALFEQQCEVIGSVGRNASLVIYLKVICSHLQLLHQLPIVLDLEFPAGFKVWLERLSFLSLDIFKVFSVQCAIETDLYLKFVVITVFPVVAVLLLGAWSRAKTRRYTSTAWSDGGGSGSGLDTQLASDQTDTKLGGNDADDTDQFLQRAFILLFAVYPMLSTHTFHFFCCRKYDEQYLHMFDYSIDCNSDEYRNFRVYAVLTVILYPIGILVACACLLYVNRARIQRSETSYDLPSNSERWYEGGSFKYRFLVGDYRKEFYWYEVFEYARKGVFTFLLGFADQGTASQIFGGLMAAICFLIFSTMAKPFEDFRVNYLRVLADAQLCFTFACCLMLKVDLDCDNLPPDFIAWLLIICNIFLTFLALSAEAVRRLALFVVSNTGLHGVLYFPGRVLGRGETSDAVVFEGEWRPLSESFGVDASAYPVAVKQCASCSSEAMVMYSKIAHENVRIPLTIERGADERFYVVSELCDCTLTDAVKDKELPGMLTELCKQIVEGVCRTHAAGILHTRLTPDNIVLDGGTAKISGWGHCRSLTDYIEPEDLPAEFSQSAMPDHGTYVGGDTESVESHTFNPLGSDIRFLKDIALDSASGAALGWQAPELLSKKLATFDANALLATDVFSLGCTMFYTLSGGNHPFGSDVDARRAAILGGQHLVYDQSTTGLSEDAKDLISSMLDPISEQRITMQAVREHPFFWQPCAKVEYLGSRVGQFLGPKVHRSSSPFLQALEEAMDTRLGGQYSELEPQICSSWARLLDPKYPLTGKWQGQTPPFDVEHNYHVYGTQPSRKQADARQQQLESGSTTQAPMEIRTVGLLKFIRNDALDAMPWLVSTVRAVDLAHPGWRKTMSDSRQKSRVASRQKTKKLRRNGVESASHEGGTRKSAMLNQIIS